MKCFTIYLGCYGNLRIWFLSPSPSAAEAHCFDEHTGPNSKVSSDIQRSKDKNKKLIKLCIKEVILENYPMWNTLNSEKIILPNILYNSLMYFKLYFTETFMIVSAMNSLFLHLTRLNHSKVKLFFRKILQSHLALCTIHELTGKAPWHGSRKATIEHHMMYMLQTGHIICKRNGGLIPLHTSVGSFPR